MTEQDAGSVAEQHPADAREAATATDGPSDAGAAGQPATGNVAVDDVLVSLRGLDGLPVDQHVEVFERAHEALRRTLNDAGQQG